MKAVKERKKLLRVSVLIVLFLACAFLFLSTRKEAIKRECTRFLEVGLGRSIEADVKIGKISGHILGFVSFKDIEVSEPWLPTERGVLFRAKEIQFRYRLLDFLSKKFDAKLEVEVKSPEIYWRPRLGLKKPSFPFLGWMRQWALSQKRQVAVRIKNMSFVLGYEEKKFSGIDITYEDNSFQIKVPVTHLTLAQLDISSEIYVEGRFESGLGEGLDSLQGTIRTEGTIINWQPLPHESSFDFIFSEVGFGVTSNNFMGGVEVTGEVDFTNDYSIDFLIKAPAYPLSNLGPFLGAGSNFSPQGRIDLETHFHGSPWAPSVESRARIYKGWLTQKDFKAMDVNVTGVYPTVHLEDSRILLEDGSVMRFADKVMEAKELFKEKTYEALVDEAQQDTVVMGDWEFSRPRDSKDQPEFLMQRSLGEKASVHFRKFNDQEETLDSFETRDMEVGFEYRLRAKDFLKLEFREDEEFVGVERKMRF